MSTAQPAIPAPLPEVLEIKRYLDGREKQFRCGLVECDERSAVLLYIACGSVELFGLTLPAGTVTFGYYWVDRPYNIYHWQAPDGRTIAAYFNLADGTRLTDGRLEWRDLTVDVLATPDGRIEVLDEDELPADLEPDVRATIEAAKQTVLGGHLAIVAEVEARSRQLWPRVFGYEKAAAAPG